MQHAELTLACVDVLQAKLFPHHHVTRHIAVAAGRAMAAASPSPMVRDAVEMGALAGGA